MRSSKFWAIPHSTSAAEAPAPTLRAIFHGMLRSTNSSACIRTASPLRRRMRLCLRHRTFASVRADMCGIAGILGIDSRENAESTLHAMLASIVHRGPDEEGTLIVPRVAVGTRRLSIIDLPTGSQPVWNEDGTVAVVFNGE